MSFFSPSSVKTVPDPGPLDHRRTEDLRIDRRKIISRSTVQAGKATSKLGVYIYLELFHLIEGTKTNCISLLIIWELKLRRLPDDMWSLPTPPAVFLLASCLLFALYWKAVERY